MAESFSLANIVPQNPSNNRRIWSRIEEAVRRLVEKSGDAYIVTGPIFSGRQLQTIGESRVFVPTQLYKARVSAVAAAWRSRSSSRTCRRSDYASKAVHELSNT